MTAGAVAVVCGSRGNRHWTWVAEQLDDLHARRLIRRLVEGGQRQREKQGHAWHVVGGVDFHALCWAQDRRIERRTVEADWDGQGRKAGPLRNGRMLEEERPDFLVSFPGGTGTADCVAQARAAGIEVIEIARECRFSYVPTLSVDLCREWPDALHVFGDNLPGRGRKGQAVIRGERNAVGIPTKRAPSEEPTAYLTDADYAAIAERVSPILVHLREHIERGGRVFWPEDGIGTGLAELPARAPRIHRAFESARMKLQRLGRCMP